jgi:ribose 5-phosphate isomerase A
MDPADAKQLAAAAALDQLPEAGVIGLGSGSTARLFVIGVGRLVAQGRAFRGVATSLDSAALATEVGIPLLDDVGPWDIDVCVDGADEVSPALDVIKGGGGCHTREKIVNQGARRNIIIVDESKLSPRLCERWPVPVEVLPFGRGSTRRMLEAFGEVTLRLRNGQPWLTDANNIILDVRAAATDDPLALDIALRALPGVVETGLFVGRVDEVIVAGERGIETLTRRREH